MPKLSVIVPVYNVEKYISECVCSLFEQTLDDVEYIFVNDCSTDRSIEVLQNVIDKYPQRKERITIIHNNTNLGSSTSRNAGIAKAKGEYVIFCDSDDYVEEDAYEAMYKLAVEKDADVVACGIGYYDENGQCLRKELYNKETITKDSLKDCTTIEGGIYSSSCNKMVRKKFMEDKGISFADGIAMWDDLFITIKYRLYSESFLVIDKPFYHYIRHANSLTNSGRLRRSESQIKSAGLIESFFINEHIEQEYLNIIMFLKLKSKEALFNRETLERWLTVYPESHKYIWNFRKQNGLILTFKLLLIANSGILGRYVWDLFNKIKNIGK